MGKCKGKKVILDLDKFTLSYLELYDASDRDDWLRGFALGIMGGNKIIGRTDAFELGFKFGETCISEYMTRANKCSVAGKISAENRFKRNGSFWPNGD